MRGPLRAVAVAVALGVTACAPPACSDAEDRAYLRDVDLVAQQEGRLAADAADRLARAGAVAIPFIETGLYSAEAPGRRRIVRLLAAIGSAEAGPILAHLARRDPDPEVRALAQAAAGQLGKPSEAK